MGKKDKEQSGEIVAESTTESSNNLEQVRSLLFGDEAARIDKEREAMRKAFSGELDEIKQEMLSGFNRLESELRSNIADLNSAVETENAQRIQRDSDDKDEILGRLERAEAQLADAKVDRRALADLFRELAHKLSEE